MNNDLTIHQSKEVKIIDNIIYMPILKANQGEFNGYYMLEKKNKNKMIPIFEMKTIEELKKFKTESEQEQEIEKTKKSLKKNIDKTCASFYGLDSKNHYEFLETMVEEYENIIPVVESKYFSIFEKNILQNKKIKNFILRMKLPIFIDEMEEEEILNIVKKYEKEFKILINLDLQDAYNDSNTRENYSQAKKILEFFEKNDLKNEIIISSSSLPKNLEEIENGGTKEFLKLEFEIFKKLCSKFKNLKFIYSDYGIAKNVDVMIDFSKINKQSILAKIRYTLPESYFLLKGKNADKKLQTPKISIKELIKKLIDSDKFLGEDFSTGDKKLKEILDDPKSKGTPKQVIEYTTNHHIVLILEQLSQYYESLI
ncbi:beta family protein [Fusobacterium ulcerans]|uniref:beta family protein n=1 Tax=Fusobacterium ulcerans TaxID=861 RepID=UPI001031678F|nr:hypothetical protein [Fusobacterium ulcerans]